MDAHLQDWLSLALRWFHLIAGISWIGSSFYFMWLDSSLEEPEPRRPDVEGTLWMVHSGGFYQVEKRLIGPGSMPRTLHWFKWEAFLTWLSGIFLLGVVYYLTGGVFLLGADTPWLSPGGAVALSLGVIVVSWLVYDTLWRSPLADKAPGAATALSFGLFVALVYGLCHAFSGRAAFIHVGAVLGTIMVANVWIRILPAQQRMIDATREGRTPDFTHGLRAKRRSVHNSYVTLPVLFLMISNHYPQTYGVAHNWVVLLLMFFVGAGIRHVMIVRSKKERADWVLVPVVAAIAAALYLTAPARRPAAAGSATAVSAEELAAETAAIRVMFAQRCVSCHSSHTTDEFFVVAPNGVAFDTMDQITTYAAQIRQRVLVDQTMPLANKTEMTDEERALLDRWLARRGQ